MPLRINLDKREAYYGGGSKLGEDLFTECYRDVRNLLVRPKGVVTTGQSALEGVRRRV